MSNLSYGTNPHYANLHNHDELDCCCLPLMIPVISVKALFEVCIYPYKRYQRYRLKQIFNRWRRTLSDSDKALIEKYIHGQLRLSTFYKLTPYNSSKCSQLKVMFYLKDHPSRRDVVEHLMAIPPFLLYDDYKVPHSYKIQERLQKMLKLIKNIYIEKPDHDGFMFLNHGARERYMAAQEAVEVDSDN